MASAGTPIEASGTKSGITVAVLGCGKLGTTIIQGLLRSCGGGPEATTQKFSHPITRIIAAVRHESKLQRLSKYFAADATTQTSLLDFVIANNVDAVRRADAVFLACHPNQAPDCLRCIGMQDAIADKLVISMLGGVSVATLEQAIYSSSQRPALGQAPAQIVQAIANTAAARGKSVTVIARGQPPISQAKVYLCEDLLRRLGHVAYVSPEQMPATTALCASGTAFFTMYLDAMIAGATKEGLSHDVATSLAALTMAGAADAVISGEEPGAIISRVTTPGGVTAQGLDELRQGDIHALAASALSATAYRLRLVN